MRLVRCDPGAVDPAAVIALAAESNGGERLGSIAAKLDGRVAVIFERWVAGEPQVLAPLAHALIDLLRTEFGVDQLRAGANADRLYHFYRETLGMTLWTELITYRRQVAGQRLQRRTGTAVRALCDDDLSAIAALAGDAANLLRLAAEKSPSRFVVAELDGCVAGYALSYVDGPHCLFKSLVVDPRFRQRGIGWDLACDAVDWAELLGLPSRLHTQGDNHAARRLYESLGYHVVEKTRLVYKMLRAGE